MPTRQLPLDQNIEPIGFLALSKQQMVERAISILGMLGESIKITVKVNMLEDIEVQEILHQQFEFRIGTMRWKLLGDLDDF